MTPCGETVRLVQLRQLELPGNPILDGLSEGKPANQAMINQHRAAPQPGGRGPTLRLSLA